MMFSCALTMWLILTIINCFINSDVTGMPITDSNGSPALSTDQIMKYLIEFGYLANKSVTNTNVAQKANLASNDVNSNTTVNDTTPMIPTTAPVRYEQPTNNGGLYSRADISRAIHDLQKFMSLQETKIIDAETVSVMKKPRCGVQDQVPHASWIPDHFYRRRRRRFITDGKWPKKSLTYSISQSSNKLSLVDQKSVLKEAFNRWSEVCQLTFSYTDNHQGSDISIRFASRSHGDGKPFDGPGNTLAHAFNPNSGGDVHFDEDETWATGLTTLPANSKSLLVVAVHEIGHSLGLKHSNVANSIMHPLYHKDIKSELGADDILGIQTLYGTCSTSVDTVFSWIGNGRTYIFKGTNTWRLNDAKGESDKRYPKSVQSQWNGVPDNIDEAFLWAGNWVTYFFKGSDYYRYNDQLDRVESGYPRAISTGWRGIPDNIDAAFSLNPSVSYFFKGNLCYKFDSRNDTLFSGYPKTINECFPGVPDNLDSAVRYYWDNVVYFFKGLHYYQYSSTTNTVTKGNIADKWRNLCFL